jgi:hypothetical protein
MATLDFPSQENYLIFVARAWKADSAHILTARQRIVILTEKLVNTFTLT